MVDLGANDSGTSGINDSGHVVGQSRRFRGDNYYRAVEWVNGAVNELPTLNADAQSFASDINSAGQITGQSGGHAVIWFNGQLRDLGVLGCPNTTSHGRDINELGWVVGDASFFNAPSMFA